jgi:hypothetical protein
MHSLHCLFKHSLKHMVRTPMLWIICGIAFVVVLFVSLCVPVLLDNKGLLSYYAFDMQ